MANNDIVSVYITTLNRPHLFKRAFKSVVEQSYKNIEVIVVDDFSSATNSEEVSSFVNEMRERGCDVYYFRNKQRMGACFSRNFAINKAKGQYITGLDDDDYFEPNRVQLFLDRYRKQVVKNTQFSCLYANYDLVKTKTIKKVKRKKVVSLNDMTFRNYIGNQIFTETKKLKAINGFDENLPAWQDYDCWFRLISNFGNAYNVNESTYVMDISHEEDRISTNSEKIKISFELFKGKHQFTERQMKLLYLNVLDYQKHDTSLSVLDFFEYLLACNNFNELYFLCKVYLKQKVK